MGNDKNYFSNQFCNVDELKKYQKSRPDRTFYWGPIAMNSMGIIAGPSKHFKTTACENLAYCIAAGRDSFLGLPIINKPGIKVALALLEEHLEMRVDRHLSIINTFTTDEQVRIKENLYFLTEHNGFLTNKKDWDKFEKDVEKLDTDILVIDSLARLSDGKISESDVAQRVMKKIRRFSQKLNITVVLIHHTTKLYGVEFPEMDNIKGSTDIIQESDYALGIGKKNGQYCFKTIVARYSPPSDKYHIFEPTSDQRLVLKDTGTELDIKKSSDGRYDNSGPMELLKTFKELSKKSEDGIVKTSELIKCSNFKAREVHNHRNRLLKDELIIKETKGKYKLAE